MAGWVARGQGWFSRDGSTLAVSSASDSEATTSTQILAEVSR